MSEGDGDNSQRPSGKTVPQHEIDAQITREKMARLRALRLAQEAANGPAVKPATGRKRSAAKKAPGTSSAKTKSLSDWLSTQEKEGRRN